MGLFMFLIIGGIAGWLAGNIIRGGGLGLFGNILVGIAGAYIGGWLGEQTGVELGGSFGALVTATAGAVILLFLIGVISGRKMK